MDKPLAMGKLKLPDKQSVDDFNFARFESALAIDKVADIARFHPADKPPIPHFKPDTRQFPGTIMANTALLLV